MKKYLLFIVEGQNDKKEIQAILRAACGKSFSDNYVDAYHVHAGDITTEKDTDEKNIVKKLNKIVLSWRDGGEQPFQKIRTSDVKKIIHIVDMDGVFIPEEAIVRTDDPKMQYQDRSIQYYNPEAVVGRNRKKASILHKLLTTRVIDNIPYELFFVSCNMDHVLFNLRNPLGNDKGRNAFVFATQCKDRVFLQGSVFAEGICAPGSFEESWKMIQDGFNSLGRHTNVNLFLDYICQETSA